MLNIKNGLYFNITGPDGSGKNSVIDLLLSELDIRNIVLFQEPGGTPTAEIIRETILTLDEEKRKSNFMELLNKNIDPLTNQYIQVAFRHYNNDELGWMEVYLYAASRSITNREIVQKMLKENKTVFGIRSVSCSMSYQGKARGIGLDKVWDINKPILTKLPDFEIFLDVPTEVAIKRLEKRTEKQDRLDLETKEFHRLTREGYLEFYRQKKFPVYIIDATGTIEEIVSKVLSVLSNYTNEKTPV